VPKTDADNLTEKENLVNISLDAVHQKKLKEALKRGIYKELYKRDLLTDAQLNRLLKGDF
jgi:aryl carrier-like protein